MDTAGVHDIFSKLKFNGYGNKKNRNRLRPRRVCLKEIRHSVS